MSVQVERKELDRALGVAVGDLEKRFGAGTVMRLGDHVAVETSVVSTGSLSIDHALGIGGYPRGRIIEVYGPEASGKTTIALHAIASVQKAGGKAVFVDAEHALDVGYARALGVDTDELMLSQPDSGEQALEITESLVRSGAVDLVVVDSVAALVPKAEIEGQMGDTHMGLQARLMSQALRKLTSVAHRTNCMVLFINQVRQKIGVVFGNGEVTTGGNALKFYASVRIEVRRIGSISDKGEIIGNKTRIRIVKNKMAPPFRKVEVEIRFGRGICPDAELINLSEEHGLITRSGSWYSLDDERLGQGKERVRDRILEDESLKEKLLDGLVEVMNSK